MMDKQKDRRRFSGPESQALPCPQPDACSTGEAEDQDLSSLLGSWQAPGLPAAFDNRMLEAYRERMSGSPVLRIHRLFAPALPWGMALALAVVLAVAVLTLVRFREHHGTGVTVATGAPPAQQISSPTGGASEPARTAQQETPKAAVASLSSGKSASKPAATKASSPAEIATDFIPLVSYSELASMEGGHLVRILLPRSALADYGLPINQDRLETPVPAQVLVGQDGIARAIRFLIVQDAEHAHGEVNSRH